MKMIGKRYLGKLNVRFDEGELFQQAFRAILVRSAQTTFLKA